MLRETAACVEDGADFEGNPVMTDFLTCMRRVEALDQVQWTARLHRATVRVLRARNLCVQLYHQPLR